MPIFERFGTTNARPASMHLIQLLLPRRDNNKQEFPAAYFSKVREELTERFGGVTAFIRSPAVGLWKEADDVSRPQRAFDFGNRVRSGSAFKRASIFLIKRVLILPASLGGTR
jgi:hypothetical protein